MNIFEMLKNNYTTYKINDSSDRDTIQIMKICDICIANPDIIVYVKKNDKNKLYFEVIEGFEKSNGIYDSNPIEIILINKDNYLYIRKNETNINNIMRSINKNLLNCVECCVCYEPKENIKHILCNKCQTPLCVKCLPKLNPKICPQCKIDLKVLCI